MKRDREMLVEDLISLLLKLPLGCTVKANTVGQLIVSNGDDDVIGYVDFEEKCYVPLDD